MRDSDKSVVYWRDHSILATGFIILISSPLICHPRPCSVNSWMDWSTRQCCVFLIYLSSSSPKIKYVYRKSNHEFKHVVKFNGIDQSIDRFWSGFTSHIDFIVLRLKVSGHKNFALNFIAIRKHYAFIWQRALYWNVLPSLIIRVCKSVADRLHVGFIKCW